MNRLTKRINGRAILAKQFPTLDDMVDILCDRLAMYEDAEAEGRLLVLPCKVGDTVYFVGSECDYYNCDESSDHCRAFCDKHKIPRIRETKIKQFRIQGNQWDSMTDTDSLCSSYENRFYLKDIGKTVFRTREEAESALNSTVTGGCAT